MSHDLHSLHAALQFLLTSDMPGEHKRVLIDAVTERIRALEDLARHQDEIARHPGQWRPQEVQLITDVLQGKSANSWQEADERLMRLAGQLHRDPREVRARATELGLGSAIDFQLARRNREQREQQNDQDDRS